MLSTSSSGLSDSLILSHDKKDLSCCFDFRQSSICLTTSSADFHVSQKFSPNAQRGLLVVDHRHTGIIINGCSREPLMLVVYVAQPLDGYRTEPLAHAFSMVL